VYICGPNFIPMKKCINLTENGLVKETDESKELSNKVITDRDDKSRTVINLKLRDVF
jgi:hypothetical protein